MKKLLCLIFFLCIYIHGIRSQELEPGFLSTMPIGTNIAVASYSYSKGEIVLDNSLPIEDLNSRLNIFAAGYVRSFKLFNKLSKVDVLLPYAFGDFNGLLEGEEKTSSRQGIGDVLTSFSMILVGAEPLKPKAYFSTVQKPFQFGLSLRVRVPIGHYDKEKLINLGGNRWAFRTSVAGSYTIKKKLVFEAHISSWFFGDNDEFLGNTTSSQDPLFGGQIHATYIFKPGIWLAASVGGTKGGVIHVDGAERPPQNNNRYGGAFAYRLNQNHSFKLIYSNNLITNFGGDYRTMLVAYQFIWFDKK